MVQRRDMLGLNPKGKSSLRSASIPGRVLAMLGLDLRVNIHYAQLQSQGKSLLGLDLRVNLYYAQLGLNSSLSSYFIARDKFLPDLPSIQAASPPFLTLQSSSIQYTNHS